MNASQLPLLVDGLEAEPHWRVRISARARRLSLRVHATGRVEVVTPPRVPAQLIQQFVARHRDWVARRLAECAPQPPLVIPDRLHLPAIGREFCLECRHEPGLPRLRIPGAQQLLLRGALDSPRAWSRLLVRWLGQLAQTEFEPRLRSLATEHGFSFSRMQIRRQRSRWGSCSTAGAISLNLCALFLRPEGLRYLMLHELCHTRHMNHSPRFWRAVQACEPGFRVLDRELNQAWRGVPAWIFAG